MNEPQVWTLIGVFAAGMLGTMTLIATLFVRVLRSEIGGLRGELKGDLAELRGELKGEMSELRGELKGDIAAVRVDLANLDRDVQALMKRTFGIDRE